ncbi:MAG: hypothetical protein MI864_17455 [Pseudomonadales bacterium]|uniref:Uncharacterized protein n=1 Tax=Oleiphilus messinensis TaxID=141451 RepID=A0A1Y0ID13_9GAMM|nr:hypothetical protein [Oleiphilus messinensis]ARU58417.1 hypothetical protein OLMES_4421 [Oleiphilus messinensis]MCG8612311.1 hypothetical protein [Pseudomonadales bacterium]
MGLGDKLYSAFNHVDRHWCDRSEVDMHNWGHVKSVHRCDRTHSDWGMVKTVGKGVVNVGSSAFSTATNTGMSTLAYTAITGGTVALSATGIGAVATAGAVALGSSITAGISLHKTLQHIKNLEEIQKQQGVRFCEGDSHQHNYILNTVLPYIIAQKKRKMRRKGEETVPILGGMCTTLEEGARSIFKRVSGSRGKQRHHMAQALTVHLVSCECNLAQDIVAELWSNEEMMAIRSMDSDEAGYWIFSKMASA